MRRYAAPMEGITGYVYRNAHHRVFGGVDWYFTPFLSPGKKRGLRSRELNDVLPEHNEGVPVVPQILTNDWEDFLHTAEILREFGYEEVNLNLGCPSGTVAAKKRGAGFLGYPEELDLFLGRIFDGTDMGISVKTRIGVERPEEFERLLAIYRKYPLRELIVHPRVLRDGYGNTPDLPTFLQALEDSPFPVCYKGDLFSREAAREFSRCFPQAERVMFGRGLIADAGLAEGLAAEERGERGPGMTAERFREFHGEILRGYCQIMSGDRNVLFKMKELWFYMLRLFPDSESYGKKIRKADTVAEYSLWVEKLLREREILPQAPEIALPFSFKIG